MSPDGPDLIGLLREQGEDEPGAALLAADLAGLYTWGAPEPTRAQTDQLVARLTPFLATPSAIRRAVRAQRQQPGGELALFLAIARAQVGLFRPGFWLVSALITFVGMLTMLPGLRSDALLLVRAVMPLLAVIAVSSAFRSIQLDVLELELTCLLSPLRLALARLVVVLTYDVGLGLLLSVGVWTSGLVRPDPITLTLHWLAPLLLVAGLALVLSRWLSVGLAAALAYTAWLGVLAPTVLPGASGILTTVLTSSESVIAGVGLLLLGLGVHQFRTGLPRRLPHP